jgi:CBS domain-containing protein
MKISEIMTPHPAFCSMASSAQTAASLMFERGIGILPVVEDAFSRKLVGVVTDRDLCRVVLVQGRDPAHVWVHECMTPEPVTCNPSDEIGRALRLMREHQVRRVPVVNNNQEVVGIISACDLVRHEVISAEELYHLMERIAEPAVEHGPRPVTTAA